MILLFTAFNVYLACVIITEKRKKHVFAEKIVKTSMSCPLLSALEDTG